jgi:predicted ATP-grasp superfamily ATP-dependent carboligase
MCGCLHSVAFRTSSIDGTGQAVEGISLSADCPLTQYTRMLIKALDYTGVGCAQYIENGDTGEITFLELNPRLPGNLVFAEYAGLHMSGFLFDLVMTGNPDRTEVLCPGGVRYSWVSEDLKTVKTALTKKEITLGDALKRLWWVVRSGLRSHIDVLYPGSDCVPGNLALIRQLPGGKVFAKDKGPPPHALTFPL